MQGISNHTYQDLIQDLSFIIRKTEDKCNFHVIRVGASTNRNIIRTVLNLKKVLPHYFSATAPLHKKSDGFSLFKPSAPHDTFINLSFYTHQPLLLKQHQSRYLSFRIRPDRAFLSRFQIVCGHDVPG